MDKKMSLQIGDMAPNFSAKINGGETRSLSDYTGKFLVLYFYPKDNTSGCTKEACSFRDNMEILSGEGAEILGVSPDSVKSHEGFIEKQNLNFNLLSDEDHSIAEAYSAWGEKSMYGKKYFGVIRSTFIINPEGKIAHAWYNVKVDGHTEAVLKKLKEVKGN